MPKKSSYSMIALVVALILSALCMQEISRMTLIGVGVNVLILLIGRYVAKHESTHSMWSVWILLGSCLWVAIIVELSTIAHLVVFIAYAGALAIMRLFGRNERIQKNTKFQM